MLLCLALFLKPFYILPSGTFQLGDLCLVLALFALAVKQRTAFSIEKNDLALALFVLCVIVINSIYFAIYRASDFIIQTVYYIFNLFAVVLFRKEMLNKSFMSQLTTVLRADIYIQVIIYLLHLGRWYGGSFTGGTRYMGTFNDPNQLAFFIFCCYVFIQISHAKLDTRVSIFDELASLFVILQTASTGMLLGLCLVILPKLVMLLKRFIGKLVFGKMGLVVASICLAILIPLGVLYATNGETKANNTFVFERLEQKIQKVAGANSGKTDFNDSIVADRQLDKLILYPEKLLYGAGQGDFQRFDRAVSANEIHSSFPGMLFYYGVGPFVVLMVWVFGNFKRGWNNPYLILIYFAYFAETFTLTNQRQPLFWMMMVVASLGKSPACGGSLDNADLAIEHNITQAEVEVNSTDAK